MPLACKLGRKCGAPPPLGPGGWWVSGACTLGNSGAPSICLLQDWCLAPSLGTLAGAASPGSPLPPDRSLPWIKKTNQSPTYTFFLSRRGQTGVCLLEGWLHHMYFLGVKLEENVKMPVYSCHSPLCLPIFLRVKSELFVVTHRFSLVVFLFTSPILLLSSPQTYF